MWRQEFWGNIALTAGELASIRLEFREVGSFRMFFLCIFFRWRCCWTFFFPFCVVCFFLVVIFLLLLLLLLENTGMAGTLSAFLFRLPAMPRSVWSGPPSRPREETTRDLMNSYCNHVYYESLQRVACSNLEDNVQTFLILVIAKLFFVFCTSQHVCRSIDQASSILASSLEGPSSMVHQCYWRPDILFFYSEIGQSTNLQPTLSKSRWPLVQWMLTIQWPMENISQQPDV